MTALLSMINKVSKIELSYKFNSAKIGEEINIKIISNNAYTKNWYDCFTILKITENKIITRFNRINITSTWGETLHRIKELPRYTILYPTLEVADFYLVSKIIEV